MRSNIVEYSTATRLYCTTHDFKDNFCMPEFSSKKIIEHRFHIENDRGKSGIGYDMIIGRNLMVKLCLSPEFKNQVLQWYGVTVPMKEPSGLPGKLYLNKREMREVVIGTVETSSTREATEILVKILHSTYVKSDLKQVVNNSTQLNSEERTQLIRLLKDFEDLFDGTPGEWDTVPVDLEINTDSKKINSKYYPVHRINKE